MNMSMLIRLAVGLLFVTAGASKLLRSRSVRHTVAQYRLLPAWLTSIVASLVGPAELLIGLALGLSSWLPLGGLPWLGAAALLALFSLAIASALARGLNIPCGCGLLVGDHVITPVTLARNLILLSLLWLAR